MKVKNLSPRSLKYLKLHGLTKKFSKQIVLLLENPKHPSLHTELLEPKEMKIYSFRIDKKYRAIFIIVSREIEIIDIRL